LNAVRPENTATLLQVFYYGLVNGIVTKEEVLAWADMMIVQEDEPHYFLIEISLSSNENQLISILREYAPYLTFGTIMVRAIYGLTYHKLIAGSVPYDKAFRLISNYDYYECLSEIEVNKIYKIEESTFSSADEDAAKELLLTFLSCYKDFTLTNYKDWSDINYRIGAEMDAKAPGTVSNHQHTIEASHIQASSHPKIKLAIKIIACVALVVIVAIVLPEELTFATIVSAIWIVNSIGEYKKWV
jgi:hypothetical protein